MFAFYFSVNHDFRSEIRQTMLSQLSGPSRPVSGNLESAGILEMR